jgi:hypothetical protein
MYKIIINHLNTQLIKKENSFIPIVDDNTSYQQFIKDVAEQGIEIVEGPDIIEPDYATLRSQEYPSREEQLDMMYWDKVNGTTVWEDTIQGIKDLYPKTITGGTTIGPVPDGVQEAADNWTFNKQLREYIAALERLEQYTLSEGREALTEEITQPWPLFLDEDVEVYDAWTGARVLVEETRTVEVSPAIDPLPATIETTETNIETGEIAVFVVPNPAIVRDEEERAAAQAVVDATPQAVIEAFNS